MVTADSQICKSNVIPVTGISQSQPLFSFFLPPSNFPGRFFHLFLGENNYFHSRFTNILIACNELLETEIHNVNCHLLICWGNEAFQSHDFSMKIRRNPVKPPPHNDRRNRNVLVFKSPKQSHRYYHQNLRHCAKEFEENRIRKGHNYTVVVIKLIVEALAS